MFRLKQVSKRRSFMKRAIAQLDDPSQIASHRPPQRIPSWLAKTPAGRQEQLEHFRTTKPRIRDEIRLNRDLPSSLRRRRKTSRSAPLTSTR